MTAGEQRFSQTSSLRTALGFKPLTVARPRTAEVKHWLVALKNDPWYDIEPVPTNSKAFLDIVGISKQAINFGAYGISQHGSKVGPKVISALSPIMDKIESGEMVFVRPRTVWHAVTLARPGGPARAQPRLVERVDYNWWRRCVACQGRRYAMVSIHGQHHAACWHCIPPDQYRQMGAEPTGLRLVARWLPAEYRAT